MTRKEALQSIIQFKVDDNTIDKVLLDRAVDGTADYSADDRQEIDLCLADLCLVLINRPEVSEGGFSIKYDKAALRATREETLRKYDLKDEYEW